MNQSSAAGSSGGLNLHFEPVAAFSRLRHRAARALTDFALWHQSFRVWKSTPATMLFQQNAW